MVRLGLWVFGRKSPEERCHSHIISRVFTPSTWHLTADADLEHPDEAMLIRLFHWKVTLFSPYHTALFGREVTVHSPQLRSGELCSVSLKVKCLQKLFGIHLHRQAVSSPHLFKACVPSKAELKSFPSHNAHHHNWFWIVYRAHWKLKSDLLKWNCFLAELPTTILSLFNFFLHTALQYSRVIFFTLFPILNLSMNSLFQNVFIHLFLFFWLS